MREQIIPRMHTDTTTSIHTLPLAWSCEVFFPFALLTTLLWLIIAPDLKSNGVKSQLAPSSRAIWGLLRYFFPSGLKRKHLN